MAGDAYQPPSGPPPGYSARPGFRQAQDGNHVSFAPSPSHSSETANQHSLRVGNLNPFRRAHSPRQDQPPSRSPVPVHEAFAPPPGPPPSKHQYSDLNSNEKYEQPPGPPPPKGYSPVDGEKYEPPSGPPPSHTEASVQAVEPPPYDAWMAIPDTSLLPPPPTLSYDESPTANATADQADQARAWCRKNPLYHPKLPHPNDLYHIERSDYMVGKPPSFVGELAHTGLGTWHIKTRRNCPDTSLLSMQPLYLALKDNPATPEGKGRKKTIYFEIRVIRMSGEGRGEYEEADAGIAIGFVAPPYPAFRLPGWERASLGVHGDDGRRYVDNNRGGKDFTTAFANGEVVGIGMTFSAPRYQGQKGSVECFFTRQGTKAGSWDLYEERDQDDDGNTRGLEGECDLLAAVGMFGAVEFEIRFRRDEWLYRP